MGPGQTRHCRSLIGDVFRPHMLLLLVSRGKENLNASESHMHEHTDGLRENRREWI